METILFGMIGFTVTIVALTILLLFVNSLPALLSTTSSPAMKYWPVGFRNFKRKGI